jgi:hypothetical protein
MAWYLVEYVDNFTFYHYHPYNFQRMVILIIHKCMTLLMNYFSIIVAVTGTCNSLSDTRSDLVDK